MKRPIITLLTDFGTQDAYVASMKGVILTINPQCRLIDITHHVAPHNILNGVVLLASAYSFFPAKTIHLVVVDPGVGGPRRPVLLVTQNYYFVGPDNGLFTLVAQKEKIKQIIHLNRKKYFLSDISTTFHGRDIFAPVAAHLSRGVAPSAFGDRMDSLTTLKMQKPYIKDKALIGEIVYIDTFGNLMTNIDKTTFDSFVQRHPFVIPIGKKAVSRLGKSYGEGKKGEPFALFGSGGFLEVSVREESAHRKLNMECGDRIAVNIETLPSLIRLFKQQGRKG